MATRLRGHRLWLIGIATLLVVAATVVGIHPWSSKADGRPVVTAAHNKDIGAGVTASGTQVPDTLHAGSAKTAFRPPFGLATLLSPILAIGPSGPLPAPVTIVLPLTHTVTSGDVVVVATNQTHTADGWQLLPGTVTSDLRHVQFTVDHLSWFGALLLDVKDAVNELKQEFIDGMTSGVFAQAAPPQCQNENQARADDYSITSSAKDTMKLFHPAVVS